MKKLLLSLLVLTLFFLTACEKEHALEELASSETHDLNNATTRSPDLIAICHYDEDNDTYHIISVNENAVSAFQAQGDAVDMDGDGYFDIPNACSPTDCDDTNAAVNPGATEICNNTIDDDCDGNVDEADSDCSTGCVEGELEVTLPDGSTLYVHPIDNSAAIPWGETGNDIEGLPIEMYANSDFNGAINTATIIANQGNWNDGVYAANLCALLSTETGCEWYLPAAGELNRMYQQLGPNGSGDIPVGIYWSSTEYDANQAWAQLFSDGSAASTVKTHNFHCRCVRR